MAKVCVSPAIAMNALMHAGFCCERCGRAALGGRLEIHHVLGRKPTSLVNEPLNLVVLCKRWAPEQGCHDWAEASKKKQFIPWFEERFGPARLARLREIQRGEKRVATIGG